MTAIQTYIQSNAQNWVCQANKAHQPKQIPRLGYLCIYLFYLFEHIYTGYKTQFIQAFICGPVVQ